VLFRSKMMIQIALDSFSNKNIKELSVRSLISTA